MTGRRHGHLSPHVLTEMTGSVVTVDVNASAACHPGLLSLLSLPLLVSGSGT